MSTVTPRPTDAGHPGGRPPSLHSIIPPDPPPAYDPASAIAYTTALSLAASGPSQPRARSRHAAILLSRSDKLRIIGFPFRFVALVDAAVMQEWKAGIQEQKAPDRQSWEWKLNGNPCECILNSKFSECIADKQGRAKAAIPSHLVDSSLTSSSSSK